MQEKEQNISPIKQRILYFAGTLGLSKREFYSKIGVSRGTLESKTGITEDIMAKFIATYPEVGHEWLLTGKGEMLKTKCSEKQEPCAIPAQETSDTPNKGSENSEQFKIFSPQKSIDIQEVPLYDITAAAGLVAIIQGNNAHIPHETIIIPRAPRCDGAMFVRGDSMYPILKSGDIVMYSEIHDIEMYLVWGEMYIVAFGNDGDDPVIAVKYIQKGSDPDHVLLVSHNSHHCEKEIPIRAIRALARVNASIRFQTH